MARIDPAQRIKIYSQNADKAQVGFGVPSDVTIVGNSSVENLLGLYSLVLARYNIEPTAIPSGSMVMGDTTYHVYRLKPGGTFTNDPESDTYDGLGDGVDWIDVTFKEQVAIAIENKSPFLWNSDISGNLVHPVQMYGSDGILYKSISGGNLNADPVGAASTDWQPVIDPSSTIIFPGFVMPNPVSTVPSGWLAAEGQAVSQSLYPDLYAYLQDGTGTCIYGETATDFYLPDYRGRVPRGWDNGAGRDNAAPLAFSCTATNLSATLTNISADSKLFDIGMLVVGTGIPAGARITTIRHGFYGGNVYSTITLDQAYTGTTGAVNLTAYARSKDNITAATPPTDLYGDFVGTAEEDSYKFHQHLCGSDARFFLSDLTAAADDSNSGGSYETSTATGIPGDGSTETRTKNIAARFIIKT